MRMLWMQETSGEAVFYPVKYRGPPFHGNALKNREHREEDVVEGSDAVVGPNPFFNALGVIGITNIRSGRRFNQFASLARRFD